jgi:hypothetical protein
MDAEIGLQDRTEHIDSEGEKCSGYVFDIDDIEHWSKHRIFINFTDWRADRKTENCSEIPNNCEPQTETCEGCKHENGPFCTVDGDCKYFDRYEPKNHSGEVTEMVDPQTGKWSVEYAREMLNAMPCEECGHWEHGAGDHYYCALLAMGQECYFESKDESTLMFANTPQTERGE